MTGKILRNIAVTQVFPWVPLLTWINLIPAWVGNYIYHIGWDSSIHSQTSTVAPLKFVNGYVISSHTLPGMWLLIHNRIKLNHACKSGPWSLIIWTKWRRYSRRWLVDFTETIVCWLVPGISSIRDIQHRFLWYLNSNIIKPINSSHQGPIWHDGFFSRSACNS